MFRLLLLAVMVFIVEIERHVNIFIFWCFFIQNIGDGGELKRSVSWEDLIQLPVRIRLTGPGGWHHGHGRGKLPSQHITSPETMKYIKESEMRTKEKEQMIKEKNIVCK